MYERWSQIADNPQRAECLVQYVRRRISTMGILSIMGSAPSVEGKMTMYRAVY